MSADCADAYNLLAEVADSLEKRTELYRQGVAAGEQRSVIRIIPARKARMARIATVASPWDMLRRSAMLTAAGAFLKPPLRMATSMCRSLLVSVLLIAAATGVQAPVAADSFPEPKPVCAYCGIPLDRSTSPSDHRPGCPYYQASVSPDTSPGGYPGFEPVAPDVQADFALSMAFPIPLCSGAVLGGIWHARRLGGAFPDKGVVASWSDYVVDHFPRGVRGASGGLWGRLGALPFLVAYPVSYGVKQTTLGLVWSGKQVGSGVGWCGRQVAAPFKERPPQPSDDQYMVIARYYRQLRDESEASRKRLAGAVKAAGARVNRYLDEFIAERQELRTILAREGRQAARARARKILDAWGRAYRAKQRIAGELQATADELNRIRAQAFGKAHDDLRDYVLWDRTTDQAVDRIEGLLQSGWLTGEEAARMLFQRRALKVAKTGKSALLVAEHVRALSRSLGERLDFATAADQSKGEAIAEWAARPETQERIGRLGLGLLDKSGWAERGMELAYSIAAELLLAGQVARMHEECERLAAVRWHHDVYAKDWNRLTDKLNAWERHEAAARGLRDRYDANAKKNALRAGSH